MGNFSGNLWSSGEEGDKEINGSLFFACFLVLALKDCSINTENFCETTRVHHVLLQITLMLQHLIFQETPLLLLIFLTIVPSEAVFYYFLKLFCFFLFSDPVF